MPDGLVAHFVANLPESRRAEASTPEVAERLRELLASARADLEGLEVDEPSLAEALARAVSELPLPRGLEALRAGELYLAARCARQDELAIAAFERKYFSVVEVAARRARIGEAELKQRLRTVLFVGDGGEPKIASYAGLGDLKGWLMVTAARLAAKLATRTVRDVPVSDEVLDDLEGKGADPELDYLRARYQADFKKAFSDALAELPRKERMLLRYRFVDGLTLDETAALFQVHDATVSRWLQKVRARVLDRVRALLAERLGASPEELESLVRLVRSEADVTLTRLLESAD